MGCHGKRGRLVALVVGAVVGAAAVVAAWLGVFGGQPAAAAGLSTLCDAPGAAMSPIPTSLLFEGDAVTGEHHELTAFPASTIALAPDPDGSPAITPTNLQPVDLDGDGQPDLELGMGLRTSTAPERDHSVTAATPLDALHTENWGFAPDSAPSGVGVELVGWDLLVKVPQASWIRRAPNLDGHYAARVGFRLERRLPNGSDYLDVLYEIDALQASARAPEARFPDEVRLSVAFKDPDPANGDIVFWSVGQEVIHSGLDAEKYPPLDTGASLTRVVPDPERVIEQPLLDVDLAWDRAPDDFALGVGQTCPSPRQLTPVAHYATNLPHPAPSGHAVDVAVRSGIGSGLDGGDEVRVEGRIEQLPRLVGLLERDGVVDLVRSTEAEPTIRLDRLDVAVDDPDRSDDRPVHASGRLEGLPPHVRIDHTRDTETGELRQIVLTACPTLEVPGDLIWYFLPAWAPEILASGQVEGCDVAPQPVIRNAHLVVQNFVPEGPYGGERSAAMAVPPSPAQRTREVCRYERGRDGPWELRCDRLAEVQRTAFVLVAAQHPHVTSTRSDPDVLLVRAGADLVDIESATFRSEAVRPGEEEPPPDGDDLVIRDETAITTDAGEEPLGQVTFQLDRRTDLRDREANEGPSILVRGTVAPLPGTIDMLAVEAQRSDPEVGEADDVSASALRVDWKLPTTVERLDLDLDEVHAQLPGRDPEGRVLSALAVDGEAELSLLRYGHVDLTRRTRDGSTTDRLHYDARTPDELRLRLAARVATEEDRRQGQALRIAADARLAEELEAHLVHASDDGRFVYADVDMCDDATRCDNEVHVDAVLGPDSGVPTLATGVRPPAPVAPRPWITRHAAEANDLTVVVDPPSGEEWGASLDAHDLAWLSYEPEPGIGDVCVRRAGGAGGASGASGPVTLLLQAPGAWLEGRLDALPDQARLRFVPSADTADDDRPLLWLDTTSSNCDRDAPPVDDTTPLEAPGDDEATGRPVLEATAVLGSGSALDALAEPLLAPNGDHVSVTGEVAADRSTAFAARLRQWLPDHLLVWAPDTRCPSDCSSLPSWQRRNHSGARVRVQSTRPDLGALTVAANVASPANPCRGSAARWAIQASVAQLPGSFDVRAALRTTERLCWTTAELDAVGSIPFGALSATATDIAQPSDLSMRRTGYQGDAVGSNRTALPEYSLALRDVGRELHLTARQQGAEQPDTYPPPSGQLCPGHPAAVARGPVTVGYVGASLDLSAAAGGGQPAQDVVIDLVQRRTDRRGTDDTQALATVTADAAIDATLRTRLNNLAQHVSFTRPDPVPRGVGVLFAPLAEHFLPGVAGLAALAVDPIVGDAELEACLDFDLPLQLTLTNSRIAQLAQSGASFALDEEGTSGGSVALDVGETVVTPTGTTFRAGAPYAYRSVDWDSGLSSLSSGVVTNTWKDVVAVIQTPGTRRIGTCAGGTVPYSPGVPTAGRTLVNTSIFSGAVTGTATDRAGATTPITMFRAPFMLDLLWNVGERGALAADDLSASPGCPGRDLYQGIATFGPAPPVSMPVAFTGTTPVQETEYEITIADAQAAGPSFCSLSGWSTSAADRPPDGGPDYPVAVGADGTRYSLLVWTEDPNGTYCRITLVAQHPDGGLRWTRRISEDVEPLPFRNVMWRVRILPRADDGSVELQFNQIDLGPPERGDIYRAWWLARLDASGNGQVITITQPGVSQQLHGLLTGVAPNVRLAVPAVELTAGCTGTTLDAGAPAGAPAGAGTTRIWYLGDGTRVVNPARSVDYCYPHPGDYYAQFVDFRHITTNGRTRTEVSGSGRWEVHVPAG
jgi:hypothetical protein